MSREEVAKEPLEFVDRHYLKSFSLQEPKEITDNESAIRQGVFAVLRDFSVKKPLFSIGFKV